MKKDEELKIRISPEDKERIRAKMEEAGILNMSAYVRKMALDGICVKLDLQEVRQLIVLLQRCSNNLNQYAKRANETGSVYAADIEDLQTRLEESWELSDSPLPALPTFGDGGGLKGSAKGCGTVRALYIPGILAGWLAGEVK